MYRYHVNTLPGRRGGGTFRRPPPYRAPDVAPVGRLSRARAPRPTTLPVHHPPRQTNHPLFARHRTHPPTQPPPRHSLLCGRFGPADRVSYAGLSPRAAPRPPGRRVRTHSPGIDAARRFDDRHTVVRPTPSHFDVRNTRHPEPTPRAFRTSRISAFQNIYFGGRRRRRKGKMCTSRYYLRWPRSPRNTKYFY